MTKYCDHFNLNPTDVDVIESAIRKVLALHSETIMLDECQHTLNQIRLLNEVLGKLHNQKIFYSQVNKTGMPAG